MSLFDWSTVSTNNQTADAAINWQEGQNPSTVNDSARAMMAQLALWRNDSGGGATVGGTANAITLTLAGTMAAYTQGILSFLATATNTGATTMKVDGTTAIPLRIVSGTDFTGGEIAVGRVYFFVKNPSVAEWLIVGGGVTKAYTDAQVAAAITTAASSAASLYAPVGRSINAGTGLTGGGTLAADRTLTLANTAVTPGAYTSANITVDQQGRLTAAASGGSALPSQTGNASKVLKTDGSSASWSGLAVTANASVAVGGTVTFSNNMSIANTATASWTVTLSGLANANYSISITPSVTGSPSSSVLIPQIGSKTSTGFTVSWSNYNLGGSSAPGSVVDITIVGGL